MRAILLSLLVLTLALAGNLPAARAQLSQDESAYQDKPLLVIRYNQPRVYFDTAVDHAVTSANKVKPGVTYNVVAYIPESVSPQTARLNLRAVVERIMFHGVPAGQITWRTEPTTGGYQEIHVYVE